MAKPFLSVIIPAYNEARRLPLTLIDIDRHLSGQNFAYEIIVALSPSEDDTESVLSRFTHILKRLHVLPLSENKGKGYAVREGLKAAKGSWRLFMDADNSVSVVEFLKMIPYLKHGSDPEKTENLFDIVIGSRSVTGSYVKPQMPPMRRFLAALRNWKLRLLLLRGINDPQCGFKCFSEEATTDILKYSTINGWAIDTELLAIALRLGYKIKEIPIFYSFDPASHITAGTYLEMTLDIFKICWRAFSGSYSR